jgi:two-component system sensor histidine kinase/response regulator
MQTSEIDHITADVLHAAVHDLKGPAGRLRMLAQLLSRSGAALSDDDRKLLGYVDESAGAVGVVAEGLRTYVEMGTRPLRPEPLDLTLALESAMANLRAEMDSVAAEVTSTALPRIEADAFAITWLFQELLTNAIRFRAGGAPRVHVSACAGYISVVDNGPGIDAGMEQRVFRPFKKSSGGGGAGLGLTICRRIVEMHGGRIWVEPHEGGTDVRFSLNEARP